MLVSALPLEALCFCFLSLDSLRWTHAFPFPFIQKLYTGLGSSHAVAVVKVGVFCIIRVYTGVFDQELLHSVDTGLIITYVAAFTVLISSLIALSQDNQSAALHFLL